MFNESCGLQVAFSSLQVYEKCIGRLNFLTIFNNIKSSFFERTILYEDIILNISPIFKSFYIFVNEQTNPL